MRLQNQKAPDAGAFLVLVEMESGMISFNQSSQQLTFR